jgi:hypothetical protein
MSQAKPQERTLGVKLLSLLLAVLIWLGMVLERPGQVKITAKVRPEHLPAGLWLSAPPPAEVEVTVAGPKIRLLLLPLRQTTCLLDLSHASAGATSYVPQQESFDLDSEQKVVRVFPSTISLTLEKTRLQ